MNYTAIYENELPTVEGVKDNASQTVKTNWKVSEIHIEVLRKGIMKGIRERIPLGMDHHKEAQDEKYRSHSTPSLLMIL